MATGISGKQVKDGSVQRVDVDTTTTGQALIRKIIPGNKISITSTGIDTGTGDVTIDLDSLSLEDISNVQITSPIQNQVLKYDGTNWINSTLSSTGGGFSGDYNDLTNKPFIPQSINDLSDVVITNATQNQVLKYDGTNWINDIDSAFSGDYNDLTNKPILFSGSFLDLTDNVPIDGHSTGNWRFVAIGGADKSVELISYSANHFIRISEGGGSQVLGTLIQGPITLQNAGNIGSLGNSKITFPDSTVQTTAWVGSVDYANVIGKPTLATVATSGSYNDLIDKPFLVFDLNDLDDVVLTSPVTGQVLKYNGTDWINSTDNSFSGDYNDLTNKPSLNDISGTLSISKGGTGQSSAQSAINALTQVSTATNGYVLTKDTATGNATWKVIPVSSAVTTLNGLTSSSQSFATGTTGSDFNISSSSSTHTFNIPDASATARGLITTGTQTIAGAKTFNSTITGSISGNSGTSTKLATARTISMTGDGSWSTLFDGSANSTGTLTLANTGVVAGTYPKVTVNSKGLVTAGASLSTSDIPSLDVSKITTGILPISNGGTGQSSAQSAINALTQVSTATNEYVLTKDTATGNATWKVIPVSSAVTTLNGLTSSSQSFATGTTGSDFNISSASSTHTFNIPDASATARGLITTGTQTIAGAKTFNSTITGSISGNSGTSTKLATARTISMTGDGSWSTLFDGSANSTGTLTLANTGVVAGTYPKVTVNSKGLVTAGASLSTSDIPSLDASKITTGILPISNGGTGQITAQAAINALTQVSAATNGYVLTKDTVSGNAIWKDIPDASAAVSLENFVTLTDTQTISGVKKMTQLNISPTNPGVNTEGGQINFENFNGVLKWSADVYQNANPNFRIFNAAGVGVQLAYGATAWSSLSDINDKENLEELDNILNKIKNLRCVKYNLKNIDDLNSKKRLGLIAQDLIQDFDEVVDSYQVQNNETKLSVKYTELIPVLVKAIQELSQKVEELENNETKLSKAIQELSQKVEELETKLNNTNQE